MSTNRPENDDELMCVMPPKALTKSAQVVITCFYSNDPRQRRVVVTERGAHPIEVCERDALGNDSWRVEKDPPAAVRLETLLARAVFALRVSSDATIKLITLGKI
jgi:hypothetical protein